MIRFIHSYYILCNLLFSIQKFLVLEDELSPVKEKSQNSNVSTFNPHLELESKLHVDGEFPTVLVNEMCCSWSELESELTLIDISFKVDKVYEDW